MTLVLIIGNNICFRWSFGILLWEIFSMGATPYPGIERANLLTYLQADRRLESPDKCPQPVCALMQNCWKLGPIERPTFVQILDTIEKIIVKMKMIMDAVSVHFLLNGFPINIFN